MKKLLNAILLLCSFSISFAQLFISSGTELYVAEDNGIYTNEDLNNEGTLSFKPFKAISFVVDAGLDNSQGTINFNDASLYIGSGGSNASSTDNFVLNTNDIVRYVILDKTGGTTIVTNGHLGITETLKLESGTLDAGNKVTLLNPSISEVAQVIESTGGLANVRVERFIPAGDNDLRAFRFLSTAVNSTGTIREEWQEDATSNTDDPNPTFGTHITGTTGPDGTNGFDATGSGQASLLVFDNSQQTWGSISDTDQTILEAGNAYNLFVRGDRGVDLTLDSDTQTPSNTTLRSTGTLVTGSLITVTDLPALADGEDEFSFIGNPYQAIVDVTKVLNDTNSTNLNTNFYWVWDPNQGSNQGAYVAVALSSENFNNPGTSDANEFVQPGQSFFVQTSSTAITNLTFTETAKNVTETSTQVFSNNNQTSINLLLYKDQALNNNYSEEDALGINFTPNANNGFDQMDAAKFINIDENLARLNNANLVSIENRDMPADGESLELFTNAYSGSNYTFVVNVSNLPDGVDANLVDDYNTGTQTLLSDGTNQISFTVDSSIPGSVASDRFSIDFDVETFGVDDNELSDQISLYPNPTEGQFIIKTKGLNKDRVVNIYNMNGKQVFQKSYSALSNGELKVNAGNLTVGVYMVEMTDNQESFNTQLIIK